LGALRVIVGGRAGALDPGPQPFRADAGLLAELYEKHGPAVYARCRYLLRDDEAAKDALQEVFARALRALNEFRAAASPTTWILRIATHHCLNELRSRRAAWREQLARISKERRAEVEPPDRLVNTVKSVVDQALDPLFEATVEATEEAIVNALLAAKTTVGRDGNTAHALPAQRLVEVMAQFGRPPAP